MDTKIMGGEPRAVALAALYICDSLLLELEARGILEKNGVQGLLQDAAKTLGAAGNPDPADYMEASDIIKAIRERHARPGNAPVPS